MRALQIHGARDLRVVEIDPAPLADDEVRVAVGVGGICGSDLSYYFKGRVGDFPIREPMVLGHEVAGTVLELGASASGLAIGDRVAINPSRPCLHCDYCLTGRSNLCRDMRFYGSAARMPHVQGAFSQTAVARVDQCHPIPDDMPLEVAACAEPLAVALHAAGRAGPLLGKRVVIAGAGPIGLLTSIAARTAGAGHITITDIVEPPLAIARAIGVDETICVGGDDDPLEPLARDKGIFDVAFEATGAPAAVEALFRITRPGGRIVQIGMLPPGVVPVPANVLMAQEIDYIGSFRFHDAYATALGMLATRRIDVSPLLSATFDIDEADEAFLMAADRTRSIKVQIGF